MASRIPRKLNQPTKQERKTIMHKATIKRDGYTVHKGAIIWRGSAHGYSLKYSSIGYGAADTLAGMKALINSKL